MDYANKEVSVRFGYGEDFEKLQPLLRRNADKLKLNFENYSTAAKKIIEDKDYGFFVVAEQAGEFIAFLFMTFEWSDWRDGVFFWVQGLEHSSDDKDERASQF